MLTHRLPFRLTVRAVGQRARGQGIAAQRLVDLRVDDTDVAPGRAVTILPILDGVGFFEEAPVGQRALEPPPVQPGAASLA